MGKVLGIAALVLIGLVVFGYLGSDLPDTNPLHGLAEGIHDIVTAIVDSITGSARGVAGSVAG